MPKVLTNPEDEEVTIIPTIAESWRVPTEAIQEAVDEAISQLAPINDATLTITQNGTTKGTFTANDADDTTIELTDTTYEDFTGTDGTTAGAAGLVPAPGATDAGKYLKADGTWGEGGNAVLYDSTGQNTDGAMTQKATTDELSQKLGIADAAIIGSSEPTSSTEAKYVGQLYFDTSGKKQYYCSNIVPGIDDEPTTYLWEEFRGGIPTNATFWGASYDAVNNSVTGTIDFDTNETAANKRLISTRLSNQLIIQSRGTSGQINFNIGSNNTTAIVTSSGINMQDNKKIFRLADPTAAQDAATKNYVDTNLPSVGDATLTIQKNGVDVQTFTANSTTNATADIAVPTTVAELDDASDYAYAADLIQLESSLAEVALTGSHNDLRDIPTIDATISASSTNAVQNQAVAAALANKADSSSIGNGTLTIKRNGTSVATFSANSSTAAEADISVPTAVSQLSDASSYYTKTQVDDAISGAVSASLKYKGSCTFANLPSSGMQVGDVWNITDDFTLDGEPYTAGTNVAWNGTKWDPLAPAIDLSPYALSSSIGNGTITVGTTTANFGTFTTNQSANKTITIPAATASAHGTVIVDSALSASSNNPVRNSVIYAAIGDIETILNTLNSGTGA